MLHWNEAIWFGVALKGTAVLAAAWLGAWLLRRGSAAARHVIWTAALAALLALPLFSVSLPALQVRTPLLPAAGPVFRANAVAAPQTPGIRIAGAVSPAPARRSTDWRDWLLLLWAAGAAASVAQMLVDSVLMAHIRRRARPFPGVDPSLPARALGIRGEVPVLQTGKGRMPMAFGLFRPAVLLPADAAEWSAERRRVVLLHELAHIGRGDPATHLVARAALSLYWWNPLAWAGWRDFVKERERAADDLVLGAGARPSDYAAHLLEIARSMQAPRALGTAALAMARRSHLEGRLAAILDGRIKRAAPGRAAAAIAALAAIAVMVPFAALQAQDRTATVPADVDATIRAAAAQKNPEMLESAGKAAEVLQKYDLARRLLDAALSVRAESSGAQSAAYGAGLIQIGDLERSRNNSREADTFYAKAVAVLGSRPEAAPALIHLGISEWTRTKDPQSARDFFQRAQAADPAHAGPALTWLALIETQPAEAEDLFKQALWLELPGSAEQALTMELYSSFLNRQHRIDEAKQMQAQAARARANLGSYGTAVSQGSGVTGVRLGPGMMPPKLLFKVEPDYTEEARLAKYQGTVVVATIIGTDGSAESMRVVRGLGLGLDEQALKAISQWKFQPGRNDGGAVPVQATIEVNFRLL